MICDKISYESREIASRAAAGFGKRKKQNMHIYKCDLCDKYHISTTNKSKLYPRKWESEKVKIPDGTPKKRKSQKTLPKNYLKAEPILVSSGRFMSTETASKLKELFKESNTTNQTP